MQIGKSFAMAFCCLLLFLTAPGGAAAALPVSHTVAYAAERADGLPSESTDSDTFDPFHMLEESEQQESGQFGTMPDMKLMLKAVEIIGDTPIDALDADQLSQLEQIGVDRETLYENRELISEMLTALSDPDPSDADQNSTADGRKIMFAAITVFGVLSAAFCVIAVHRRGRKHS